MDIEKIRKRHERDADQGPDKTTYGTTAYLYAWEQAHLDRGELLQKVELQAGAHEFYKENSAGLAAELEEAEKRIEELKAENKRLFDAHSVEMVRADKLQQEVERLRGYKSRIAKIENAILRVSNQGFLDGNGTRVPLGRVNHVAPFRVWEKILPELTEALSGGKVVEKGDD